MKKFTWIIWLVVLLGVLCGCNRLEKGWHQEEGKTYYVSQNGRYLTGWQKIQDQFYYFHKDGAMAHGLVDLKEGRYLLDANGAMATGWQTVEGDTYYFMSNGVAITGWQNLDGYFYLFGEDGIMAKGWQDTEIGVRYFGQDGIMATGWQTLEDGLYYFREDGSTLQGWTVSGRDQVYFLERGKLAVGWHTIGERRYYFRENGTVATGLVSTPEGTFLILEDGSLYTGWLEQDGYRQYFFENGVMAVGRQEVDGKTYHFSPRGIEITLVNPWNPVPEDYTMERVKLDKFYVAQECYEPLLQMLADCRAQGYNPQICSAYRTQADQSWLFDNKVQRVMKEGYEEEEAKVIAAREVAVPGTSEHQLGLAVDIVDKDHPLLDESQADRPTQIWLMEHCWEYGFILRYPVGTTDQTGIIYEPWHYRYVGREIAIELKELGITLEEYLGVA